MPSVRTEITEIVTGLAMLGHRDLKQALEVRPARILNVEAEHFDRLDQALGVGKHHSEFQTAWDNGVAFARSSDGLRGRPPWHIEWKGPHKPPGYEQIPADLRVDHVYLVSCKYGSSILHNASPAHLFDRALAERRVERGADWFLETAPEAYQALYEAYRDALGVDELPATVGQLDRAHRDRIKAASPGRAWPGRSAPAYREFALAVAQQSATRWLAALDTAGRREAMLWRLLRLQAAPYFVLGAGLDREPLRYRVGTPWDFRDAFRLRSLDAWADPAGQPLERWRADVIERHRGARQVVEGHVEIRWSHGKFAGAPEAKVHLDTHPHQVAGYVPLA